MLPRFLALGVAAVLALPAHASAEPKPFGHACTPQGGVRFCAGSSDVTSWDGGPKLDVDVTLPAGGDGPWPTLVMLHGYGGSKADFESTTPTPANSELYHYNTDWFASRGYAVLTYTARGFNGSCGTGTVALDPTCQQGVGGYIHLKDQRVEIHDTQFLLGTLADEGIADPAAIGTTGISYGGGESIMLAYLRDRVRNTDGTFSPWTSPKGTPMHIAAAWPRWPWSDLVASLLPNGRFLDFDPSTDGAAADPPGIEIQSYVAGLYALGQEKGHYAAPGTDPTADLTTWFVRTNAGEPYSDPETASIIAELRTFHSGWTLGGTPAPLLIENGWTDDLFPPTEALRVYDDVRSRDPRFPVALQFGDLGHSRGSNKLTVNRAFNDQGTAFLDARLKGDASAAAPAPGSVTAFTQTCPSSTPDGGPYSAASWPQLHPGAVLFASHDAQTVTSAGGDPTTAEAIDPIANSDACKTVAAQDGPGTAIVSSPKVDAPYTLMGLPTVRATIATTGVGGQLDSRLWDVGPDGNQTLVSRGAFRLLDDQAGTVTFQLHGNGYRFERGHVAKLELLGRDAPYLRPSNGPFTVAVSDVSVELPTLEAPGAGSVSVPQLGSGGCARASALAHAAIRPHGRSLRIVLPATPRSGVDVFQQSIGRDVLGNRLVARFGPRRGSFTWNGASRRGRPAADGILVVRVRTRGDERRFALTRSHGRLHARPAYAVLPACGLIARLKLERPAFGGIRNAALGVAYRLREPGTARVDVLARGRTVDAFRARRVAAGRLVRLRVASEHLPRGEVRVTLRVSSGGRTATQTVVARRL